MDQNFLDMYWNYYLALESDVIDIERYVSFHSNNFNCFSNEFVKVFQAICSEVDVICKNYCRFLEGDNYDKILVKSKENIRLYRDIIFQKHPVIADYEIYMKNCNLTFAPLKDWKSKASPYWWISYNNIKHNRTSKNSKGEYNFQDANLKNVLSALSALYIIEIMFYFDFYEGYMPGYLSSNPLMPKSKYLGIKNYPINIKDILPAIM